MDFPVARPWRCIPWTVAIGSSRSDQRRPMKSCWNGWHEKHGPCLSDPLVYGATVTQDANRLCGRVLGVIRPLVVYLKIL
jgi:hypothetical protein